MNKKVKRRCKGFTLVELVIVIAIVIILSVISVPIYRGYVDKAKFSEAYALLGNILSAQKAYYSEHGNFLTFEHSEGWTCNSITLGIDARGNKYFTWFRTACSYNDSVLGDPKNTFAAAVNKPKELNNNDKNRIGIRYFVAEVDGRKAGVQYTEGDSI